MERQELKGVDGRMPDAVAEDININVGTLEELASVELIGNDKARKIIDYRDENGAFATWEELKNVGFSDEEILALKTRGAVIEGVAEE